MAVARTGRPPGLTHIKRSAGAHFFARTCRG